MRLQLFVRVVNHVRISRAKCICYVPIWTTKAECYWYCITFQRYIVICFVFPLLYHWISVSDVFSEIFSWQKWKISGKRTLDWCESYRILRSWAPNLGVFFSGRPSHFCIRDIPLILNHVTSLKTRQFLNKKWCELFFHWQHEVLHNICSLLFEL